MANQKPEIHLLGTLELVGSSGNPLNSILCQPKRTALLAFLTLSARRGYTRRDSLLGMFWPEYSETRARGSLRTALHGLRSELGNGTIVARGDDAVTVCMDLVTCDVVEFERAIVEGHLRTAFEIYRGPLLTGFTLKENIQFDYWLEAEREELAGKYSRLLEDLAHDASLAHKPTEVAEWCRRLALHSPYSAAVAIRYMKALDGIGDRAEAIAFAERHATRLRQDLDAAPSPDVMTFAKNLREAPQRRSVNLTAAMTGPSTTTDDDRGHGTVDQGKSPAGGFTGPTQTRSVSRRNSDTTFKLPVLLRRWSHRIVQVVAGAVLITGLAWGGLRFLSTDETARNSNRLAVYPANVTGGDSMLISDGLARLLAFALDGAGEIRVIDPNVLFPALLRELDGPLDQASALRHARQNEAHGFVLIQVVNVDGRLRVRASLYSTNNHEPTVTADASGDLPDLPVIAEELARNLITGHPIGSSVRLNEITSVRQSNFAALKAYLEGEAALYTKGHEAALAAFSQAVDIDTTFALAWYRLSVVQGWLSVAGKQRSLARALQYKANLAPRDLLLVEIAHAFGEGDDRLARQTAARTVGLFPRNPEAWWWRGEVAKWYNWRRGVSFEEAESAYQRAADLDSNNREAIWGLMTLAMARSLPERADSLAREWLARGQHAYWSPVLPVFGAFNNTDEESQAEFLALMRESQDAMVGIASGFAQSVGLFHGADRLAEILTDPMARPARAQLAGHTRQAYIDVIQGRWELAAVHFERAANVSSVSALAMNALIMATTPGARNAAMLREVRNQVVSIGSDFSSTSTGPPFAIPAAVVPYFEMYVMGLLEVKAGNAQSALQYAQNIDAAVAEDTSSLVRDLALEVRAFAALESGEPDLALELLEKQTLTAAWSTLWNGSLFISRPFGRYLRAEALLSLERYDEALGWYESFGTLAGTEHFRAWFCMRRAQIHDLQGDEDLARQEYRRFLNVWGQADPELQGHIAYARDRIREIEQGPTS